MKYVMFKVRMGEISQLVPVIFPNNLVHGMVAEAFMKYMDSHGDVVIDGQPISAGDVHVEVGPCHGCSTTLKLDSNPLDSVIINSIDYTHGIVDKGSTR